MQQSSRRPPTYPKPAYAAPPQAAKASPPATASPAPRSTYAPAAARAPVVIRPLWLRLVGVGGILHAAVVLLTIVVFAVMALGGDSRVAVITGAIRSHSSVLWTWSLFAAATSFVLAFVLLYNAIGTLSLSPWSRPTSVRWSAVFVATATAALIVNIGWVYPLLRQASPERFNYARMVMVTWAHIAAGLLWPGFVLLAMSTRRVKDLYARLTAGASVM